VFKQIMQALESISAGSASGSGPKRERILAILKRYAADEIGLDQAYYDLLEDELIPMPQRCGLSAKVPVTAEDEEMLKERIRHE
jgi:hypothetical protein